MYYKPLRVNNFWSDNYIEYNIDANKKRILSIKEYLDKNRAYLEDIINYLKKSGIWKIQLTIVNNFFSSIDNDEERVMHAKSDNIEIMMNLKAGEIMEKIFDLLKIDIKKIYNQYKVVSLTSIMFDYDYIALSIKKITNILNTL